MLKILKTKCALFGLPQQRKMKQAIPFQLRLDKYCRRYAGHGSVNFELQKSSKISRKFEQRLHSCTNCLVQNYILSFSYTSFTVDYLVKTFGYCIDYGNNRYCGVTGKFKMEPLYIVRGWSVRGENLEIIQAKRNFQTL
jgi:hypothetical protein